MDMEWGIDERDGKVWLLQARPETVWSRKKADGEGADETDTAGTENLDVIVTGLPASPGKVAGKAHVITDPALIDEFKDGEILVTTMTAPDWVPAMQKALAIVTDAGGMTCHAAIVSREMGIPCIVGTASRSQEATASIEDGQEITVDASNGTVYAGIVKSMVSEEQARLDALVKIGALVKGEVFINAEKIPKSDVFTGDYVLTFRISTTPLAKSLTADVVWTNEGYATYFDL